MKLTPTNKSIIDDLSYKRLLYVHRFALPGNRWTQGETGEYWKERMKFMRGTTDHVAVSKELGFELELTCQFCFSEVLKTDIHRCSECAAVFCSDEHRVNHIHEDCDLWNKLAQEK